VPYEFLVAFSCKGRWFCPSCHSKKTIQFGEDVPNKILYPVPHRQFVFSIPKMLRIYSKSDRKLLTEHCHCAKDSREVFFRTVLGMIMVIYTFGDYARFHPHLHAIVADGLFPAEYRWEEKDAHGLREAAQEQNTPFAIQGGLRNAPFVRPLPIIPAK